ncbi:unnamed protein product [Notodromas monacha]|uniref:lysozyme n=1 Tax=Notodromas monacha TaxID=399045 RepID=A0A7R9GC40_9CRUS|nr:unnamed protein product [Notodromas monacha]CAG0915446.1 unnamed protein product [Notodromas monacha]
MNRIKDRDALGGQPEAFDLRNTVRNVCAQGQERFSLFPGNNECTYNHILLRVSEYFAEVFVSRLLVTAHTRQSSVLGASRLQQFAVARSGACSNETDRFENLKIARHLSEDFHPHDSRTNRKSRIPRDSWFPEHENLILKKSNYCLLWVIPKELQEDPSPGEKSLDDGLFETSEGNENDSIIDELDAGDAKPCTSTNEASRRVTISIQETDDGDLTSDRNLEHHAPKNAAISKEAVEKALGDVSHSMFQSFTQRKFGSIADQTRSFSQAKLRRSSKPRPVQTRNQLLSECSSQEKVVRYEKIMQELAISLLGEEHAGDPIVRIAADVASAAVSPANDPEKQHKSEKCVGLELITTNYDRGNLTSLLSEVQELSVMSFELPTSDSERPPQNSSHNVVQDSASSSGVHGRLRSSEIRDCVSLNSMSSHRTICCNAATSIHTSSLDSTAGSQVDFSAFVDPVWVEAIAPESRAQFYQSMLSASAANDGDSASLQTAQKFATICTVPYNKLSTVEIVSHRSSPDHVNDKSCRTTSSVDACVSNNWSAAATATSRKSYNEVTEESLGMSAILPELGQKVKNACNGKTPNQSLLLLVDAIFSSQQKLRWMKTILHFVEQQLSSSSSGSGLQSQTRTPTNNISRETTFSVKQTPLKSAAEERFSSNISSDCINEIYCVADKQKGKSDAKQLQHEPKSSGILLSVASSHKKDDEHQSSIIKPSVSPSSSYSSNSYDLMSAGNQESLAKLAALCEEVLASNANFANKRPKSEASSGGKIGKQQSRHRPNNNNKQQQRKDLVSMHSSSLTWGKSSTVRVRPSSVMMEHHGQNSGPAAANPFFSSWDNHYHNNNNNPHHHRQQQQQQNCVPSIDCSRSPYCPPFCCQSELTNWHCCSSSFPQHQSMQSSHLQNVHRDSFINTNRAKMDKIRQRQNFKKPSKSGSQDTSMRNQITLLHQRLSDVEAYFLKWSNMNKCVMFQGLVSVLLLALVNSQEFIQVSPVISDECIGCICEGSTSCDLSVKCTGGGYLCGPLLISRAYWTDGGQPVLKGNNKNQNGAFENCVQDPYCAAQTMRGYMSKFKQDCNGDGKIDCVDFAMIHKSGGYSCSTPIQETEYFKKFLSCKNLLNLD